MPLEKLRSATGGKAEASHGPGLDDNAAHLLLIDDDRRIRELLGRYLAEHGYRVTMAGEAASARRKLEGMEFDLLIVDVMMPGESGISLTHSLRSGGKHVPVLMLTALAEADSRIEGLEAGADDYLPKPFEPRELLLRIASILKRTARNQTPTLENIAFGPYRFSLKKRELKRADETIRLTEREIEIMLAFAARPGETVARHELLGDDTIAGERKIDVQINRLRRKIEDDPANPKWLQTVRGIGYRLSTE
ncbi:MAG: response regulator [Nitratireductor sp.]|nr:response regulator [Nitratireductor sp.]MCB1457626.1 response regulator [Nitratireductor sp.]MCB1458834.1 response regulator [Nitratireductor sp.]